jgi:lipopolysaccharide export system ATP-binding protein
MTSSNTNQASSPTTPSVQGTGARLEARCLKKSFDGRSIVEDVSFSVNQGEVIGLLGPNGAGKTTSFYMTVGLLRPDGGQVALDGEDISALPIHRRARRGIGYLPQNASVFRKLSVENNLVAAMEIWGTPRAERGPLLESLLQNFGIAHLRKSAGLSLSGGERRRLEIARALVTHPRFLLLDEPFAGIDPVTVDEIQGIIRRLVTQENIGVLITDHNVRETLSVCDRAYILAGGKIIAEGEPEVVANLELVRQVYLGENFAY